MKVSPHDAANNVLAMDLDEALNNRMTEWFRHFVHRADTYNLGHEAAILRLLVNNKVFQEEMLQIVFKFMVSGSKEIVYTSPSGTTFTLTQKGTY